jgi:tRNA-Thr(GGU) m(6)t(6)A37 methyltransferase TsaA
MAANRPHFTVTPIGVLHRPDMPDDARSDRGAYYDPFAETIIEIFPEWEAGLLRIEEFSHLVVVLFMDRAEPLMPGEPLTRRGESRAGLPPIGLFATRSPHRPNPIGLCYPKILHRDGRNLHVIGMDGWPGTPVLDIKGYYLRDEQRLDATAPSWLQTHWAGHDAERGGPPPLR